MFYKSIIENRSAAYQLLVLLILFIACLALSTFLFALFLIPFYGVDVLVDLQSVANISTPSNILVLKFMQIFSTLGSFILPPLLLAYLSSSNTLAYLSIKSPEKMPAFFAATFLLVITGQPLINLLVEINSHVALPDFLSNVEEWMKQAEEQAEELTKAFLQMNSANDLLLNMFVVAILPAIGEELVFRGVLQKLFSKITRNAHAGIWISAILFSAIHFQFYGFLPRMLMGAMFGYLLFWSGSLWITIWAHFVNNGMAVWLEYLSQRGIISEDLVNVGAGGDAYLWVLSSLLIVSLLLIWMYKNKVINQSEVGRPESED